MKVEILVDAARLWLWSNVKRGDIKEVSNADIMAINAIKKMEANGKVRIFEAEPEIEKPAKTPSPDGEKTPIQIDQRLAMWLENNGFVRGPNGSAYSKTGLLGDGAIIKLIVDFKNNEKGNRYGLRFDEVDGKWVNDLVLRDHPDLLEFKAYRDNLLKQEERKPEIRAAPNEGNREIPAASGEGQQLALMTEAKDDTQIIAELQGDFQAEVLQQYFYTFESKGRKVVGLSYKGVKQIALKQGHIEVKELELRERPEAWIAICKAKHKQRDLEVYGVAWQEKQFRNGESDPFSLQKAVSKAQRNAIKALISEAIITEAYKAWLEHREEFLKF